MVTRCFKAYDAQRASSARTFVFAVLFMAVMQAGCTVPLLKASAIDDMDTARELIQEGHDVNKAFPIVGTTALMLAASQGHTELVQVLIDAGADVNARDFTGWTALHGAAYKGSSKVVLLLLEHGAVSSGGGWFLPTPGEVAETLGHRELIPLFSGTDNPAQGAIPSSSTQSFKQGEAQHIRAPQDMTEEGATVRAMDP